MIYIPLLYKKIYRYWMWQWLFSVRKHKLH